MSFLSVTAPAYADAANKSIRCQVTFPGRTGAFAYLAADGDETSQSLFNDCVAGVYGSVAAFAAATATAAQLRDYAFALVARLLASARSYALGGPIILADATTATETNLNGLVSGWAMANPTATTPWVDNNGTVTAVTGAQIVTLAQSVLAYGQSVYAALAAVMTGVASGAIVTTADIDAAAWPT